MQHSTILLTGFVLGTLAMTTATKIDRRVDARNLQVQPTGFTIDVNNADADSLAVLPSIGPNLAHRIVDYRTAHGSFRRVDDLRAVSGIGNRTLQRFQPYVRCGDTH